MGRRALGVVARNPLFRVAAVVSERSVDRANAAIEEEAPQLKGLVSIGTDFATTVQKAGGADVVILATHPRLKQLVGPIMRACELGLSVVCIGEEAIHPAAVDREIAAQLDAAAVKNEVAIVGTGVNPGFIQDLLPLVLTAPLRSWRSLLARRVSDLAPYGPTVLKSMGIGMDRKSYSEARTAGKVAGHIGFEGSVAILAAGLGIELRVESNESHPIVREHPTEWSGIVLEPGTVVGVTQRCSALSPLGQRVVLDHPQRIGVLDGEEPPHDLVEVDGDPPLRLRIQPGLEGGAATVGLMVNVIHALMDAAPGLHPVSDLPLGPLGRARLASSQSFDALEAAE
jgi:4-hydroxy-tetrahydrodipicolinate reductase